jgi:hypothetical protein
LGFKEAIALLTTYAGMEVNSKRSEAIYDEMVVHRTFPDDFFIASGRLQQALKQRMQPSS